MAGAVQLFSELFNNSIGLQINLCDLLLFSVFTLPEKQWRRPVGQPALPKTLWRSHMESLTMEALCSLYTFRGRETFTHHPATDAILAVVGKVCTSRSRNTFSTHFTCFYIHNIYMVKWCVKRAKIITYGHVINYVLILPIWNSYGSHVDDNPSDIYGKTWSSAGEHQIFGISVPWILAMLLLLVKMFNSHSQASFSTWIKHQTDIHELSLISHLQISTG